MKDEREVFLLFAVHLNKKKKIENTKSCANFVILVWISQLQMVKINSS